MKTRFGEVVADWPAGNRQLLELAAGLVDSAYIEQARQARRVTEQLEKAFVKKPALAALAKQEAVLGADG